MSRENEYLWLWIDLAFIVASFWLFREIYNTGFLMGEIASGRKLSYVKKRTLAQGNILQYPFGKARRQTPETGDSHCLEQSGAVPQEPEEA